MTLAVSNYQMLILRNLIFVHFLLRTTFQTHSFLILFVMHCRNLFLQVCVPRSFPPSSLTATACRMRWSALDADLWGQQAPNTTYVHIQYSTVQHILCFIVISLNLCDQPTSVHLFMHSFVYTFTYSVARVSNQLRIN